MTISTPGTILALDIATTCGWAFAKGNRIVAWGIESFKLRGDDPYIKGNRLINFYNWLTEFRGVEEIIIERVAGFQSSQHSTETYYGMLGVIRMVCAGNRIPLSGMWTSTLKKEFVGNGRATKQEMCAFAHRLGWTGGLLGTDQDHDAADACALIICKQKERGIEVSF